MVSKKISRRKFVSSVGAVVAAAAAKPPLNTDPHLKPSFSYGPQVPREIPILPGLNIGRSFFEYDDDPPPKGKRYRPSPEGGFAIHNGPDTYNHILMGEGVWYLLAGDKPRLKMLHRTGEGGYAEPGILPGLGVGGRLRLSVTARGAFKWLDQFESIQTRFAPGFAAWLCSDSALGVSLSLEARPLISANGFIASAALAGSAAADLTWAFGAIGENNDSAEFLKDRARLSNPALPFTEVFAGIAAAGGEPRRGAIQILFDSDLPPNTSPELSDSCALFDAPLHADSENKRASQFVCVWGYRNFDRHGLEAALARLKVRPFADAEWLEEMKGKWFHHWIGRGLEAEKKFLEIRSVPEKALLESNSFWDARERLRIKTPDPAFDNVVNNEAANLRHQFEYPAFIHGLINWSKYGKLSCGYYGPEAAGYHAEVESSLKFISGTQDAHGRQRYFTPAFAISNWAEEQDFYYVEQVWYHYRWTGSLEFLQVMWPSVRRCLDHALAASDPDGDGVMTGYYEFWNNDMHSRGGLCVVHTAMAWAALRSATEIAKRLQDKASAEHYAALARKVNEQIRSRLWHKEVGAFCSAEWNGSMRPHPEAQEQFLPIVHGMGEPPEKYRAMRYIRDVLFIEPQPNVTLELMNDWWPIGWSHHYVANGDTALSALAACKAGDIENFWPALKTLSDSAYESRSATLCHSQRNDGTGVGMTDIAELQGPFIQAVAEGIFGLEPDFGQNLLALRPNFPRAWDRAEITTPDLCCSFRKTGNDISFTCETPVPREVRLEFPVSAEVKSVELNGKEHPYAVSSEVNYARIIVHSGSGVLHRFGIRLGESVSIGGSRRIIKADTAQFIVRNAAVQGVLAREEKIGDLEIQRRLGDTSIVSFQPIGAGRETVFLEIESGRTRYLHPLDLEIIKPWSVAKRYVPAFQDGGPAVSSPGIDAPTKTLLIEIQNQRREEMSGSVLIRLGGKTFHRRIAIPPAGTESLRIPIHDWWRRRSPGALPVEVELAGCVETCEAVNWEPAGDPGFGHRLQEIDLRRYYNADLRTLYSDSGFEWRLDYAGGGVAVDCRNPMPEKDHQGFILTVPPVSQLTWGCLPEQRDSDHRPRWCVPDLGGKIHTAFGVGFSTDARTGVLALVNTWCSKALPSSVVFELEEPLRLEKMYLLTANLTKTLKCYYPGAEIIAYYTDGSKTLKSLIPPFTMSCVAQHFCPTCYAIPYGYLAGSPVIPKPQTPNLAVSDLVLDPEKSLARMEFRCVASETIFGILGMTLLRAPAV